MVNDASDLQLAIRKDQSIAGPVCGRNICQNLIFQIPVSGTFLLAPAKNTETHPFWAFMVAAGYGVNSGQEFL
ncbi:MAG: hypothetical protein CMQ11_12435 [Gammaproteobacteria bacterium]|nr:hypothetical protein [Gammaproteobacteria bacterium]